MNNKKTATIKSFPDLEIYNKSIEENGLKIVSEQLPTANSFALGIWVNFGSRDESIETPGIAHFIEHMNFRRSTKHNYRQIANAFENLGAYINAFTNQEQTVFYVRALNKNLKKCLSLLLEIVFEPYYIESDFQKEKDIIIEEIRSYRDDPEESLSDIAESIAYQGHPLGNPIVGTEESVSSLTCDTIIREHNNHYTFDNTLISYIGSLEHRRLVDMFYSVINGKAYTSKKMNSSPRTTPAPLPSIRKVEKKPLQQAHLIMNKRIDNWNHIERYNILVLNTLLGDSMSSRLYQSLREKYAFVYSTYSSLQFLTDTALISVYAAANADKIETTEKVILKEFENITKKPVSKTEFKRAKEQIKSSVIMDMENLGVRMQNLAKSEILTGKYESVEGFINYIDNVTIEDLHKSSIELLSPDNWNVLIFHP